MPIAERYLKHKGVCNKAGRCRFIHCVHHSRHEMGKLCMPTTCQAMDFEVECIPVEEFPVRIWKWVDAPLYLRDLPGVETGKERYVIHIPEFLNKEKLDILVTPEGYLDVTYAHNRDKVLIRYQEEIDW